MQKELFKKDEIEKLDNYKQFISNINLSNKILNSDEDNHNFYKWNFKSEDNDLFKEFIKKHDKINSEKRNKNFHQLYFNKKVPECFEDNVEKSEFFKKYFKSHEKEHDLEAFYKFLELIKKNCK
ncbi:MAG: hypothetical protein IMY72_03890 [Bacteroidetes bacterium]|nr:hypothetical protein [Bacteroidota bacterium]